MLRAARESGSASLQEKRYAPSVLTPAGCAQEKSDQRLHPRSAGAASAGFGWSGAAAPPALRCTRWPPSGAPELPPPVLPCPAQPPVVPVLLLRLLPLLPALRGLQLRGRGPTECAERSARLAAAAACGEGVSSAAAAGWPAVAASSAAAAPMVHEGWLCSSAGVCSMEAVTAGGGKAGHVSAAGETLPPLLLLPPSMLPSPLASLQAPLLLRPSPSSCASEERMQ